MTTPKKPVVKKTATTDKKIVKRAAASKPIEVDQSKIITDEEARLVTIPDNTPTIQGEDIEVNQSEIVTDKEFRRPKIGRKNGAKPEDWEGLGGKRSIEYVENNFDLVYCAGPMNGYENFNFPAFDEARDYVNGLGGTYGAISPADMDRAKGFQEGELVVPQVTDDFFQDCMRRDLRVITHCHAILLMRGWEKSKGANNELFIARACGVKVWLAYYDEPGERRAGYDRNRIISYTEAPDWLRSPLIYGDNGSPLYTSDAEFRKSPDYVINNSVRVEGTHRNSTALDKFLESTSPKSPIAQKSNIDIVEEELNQTLGLPPTDPDNTITAVNPPTVLEEANGLIYGDRNASYGSALEDFTRAGRIWGPIIGELKPGEVVSPEKVGLCMIGIKISREVHRHKRDSLVDIAGYAGCISDIYDNT